ncbi:MAG TPA: DUF4229 domain-containing protein [Streptosporangiaceae bacterium]|jgi:hypothetical protein
MRATVSYTLLRLLLFFAVVLLVYVAGARGLLLVAIALVISGVLSFLLLSRQRDAMSGALSARLQRRRQPDQAPGGIGARLHGFRQRLEQGARAEDDD